MANEFSDYKAYLERPIMLSPAPGESDIRSFQQNVNENHPQNFQSERNQSVGYNLQQEFEALKADLDLDLSYSNTPDGSLLSGLHTMAVPGNQRPMATPNSVSYGLPMNLGLTGGIMQDTLARDRALSPSTHSLLGQNSGLVPSLSSVPNRPQSVNEFPSLLLRQQNLALSSNKPSSNFYLDIILFTNWIENLNPQETLSMLDYWCNHLPFDILLTMKSKLQSHLTLRNGNNGAVHGPLNPGLHHLQYTKNFVYPSDFVNDMDSLSIDESMRSGSQNKGLVQPKPKTNNLRSHLFESKVQRPKLADPTLNNRFQAQNQPQTTASDRGSPTSHLYEKTNFLQLAAASNLPLSYTGDSIDLSATNKLGALATINSRVALDSRKTNHLAHHPQQNIHNQAPTPNNRVHSAMAYEESLNRLGNSSLVPVVQKYSSAVMGGKDAASPNGKVSGPSTPLASMSNGNSSMPPEISSPELLANIPAWLKLLRLHKYTDCLKDIYWEDLVDLTDQDLEARGVKALGARRKLLKAFEAVKSSKA